MKDFLSINHNIFDLQLCKHPSLKKKKKLTNFLMFIVFDQHMAKDLSFLFSILLCWNAFSHQFFCVIYVYNFVVILIILLFLSQPHRTKLVCDLNHLESCLRLCSNQTTRLLSWESTIIAAKIPFKNTLFPFFFLANRDPPWNLTFHHDGK